MAAIANPTLWSTQSMHMRTLTFDNRFVAEVSGDNGPPRQPRQVKGAAWSHAVPTPVRAPKVLAHAHEVATLLGLSAADVDSPWFAQVFSGNRLVPGMQPYAACYGGHQFGNWAGQLGDGRAMSLGEMATSTGRWELQLKGAGPTPYSRRADGRAVLRSSIREFLCSEAMHHLGVPTTRALSLLLTGDEVVRDVLYDGNPRPEPGAIVCRVAPSFLRFGTFELPALRGDYVLLARLLDFTVDRDFPAIAASGQSQHDKRAAFFVDVCERTALLLAHWMRVGFVHGVMNTDNMSILGLTIDYGPYGWVDDYDPDWTPNTTDAERRRYRFGNQPAVALWNLQRLAEALLPLFDDEAPLQRGLEAWQRVYRDSSRAMTAQKFGLTHLDDDDDDCWLVPALNLLQRAGLDMTLFFRGLADVDVEAPAVAALRLAFYDEKLRSAHEPALQAWLLTWAQRVRREPVPTVLRRQSMNAVNPRFVLRNYLAQEAIEAAEGGDPTLVTTLLEVLRQPYSDQVEHPLHARFAARRPEWARLKVGSSMLSCSS